MANEKIVFEEFRILEKGSTGRRRATIYMGSFINNDSVFSQYKYNYCIHCEQYAMSPEIDVDYYSLTRPMAIDIAEQFLNEEI
jgi:hypothetical protein